MIKKRWLVFAILLVLSSSIIQAYPFVHNSFNFNLLFKSFLQKRFNDYDAPEATIILFPKYMLDYSTALIKFKVVDKKTRITSVNARLILPQQNKKITLFDDGLHSDNNANDLVFTGYLRTYDFGSENDVVVEITAIDQALNKITVIKNIDVLPRNTCKAFVSNGNSNDKIDIIILGDKYSSQQEMINDFTNTYINIFSFEPLKTGFDQKKFNVFYIDSTKLNLGCKYGCYANFKNSMCCNAEKLKIIATQCPSDIIGVISDTTQYGGSYNYNPAYFVMYKHGYKSNTAVHEFGHALGLMDEYDYQISAPANSLPWGPNCEARSSCNNWIGISGTGCFNACSFSNWFRPLTDNTLMYDNRGDFGPVNQKHLNNILLKYR